MYSLIYLSYRNMVGRKKLSCTWSMVFSRGLFFSQNLHNEQRLVLCQRTVSTNFKIARVISNNDKEGCTNRQYITLLNKTILPLWLRNKDKR